MTQDEILAKVVCSDDYNFLLENEHLGDNIIILGLGGSHAYGTSVETSDLDIRGCALNRKEELLTNVNFKIYEDRNTDTMICGFNHMIYLLQKCTPNIIELLGLRPEHYLYVSPIGRELINNAHMFLSKIAIYSFGHYASSQLRKLENKAIRDAEQSEQEQHILKTIESARYSFPEKYFDYPEDSIKLYVDKAVQPDYDTEIFMDVNLTHYPLRDYKIMWSEMNTMVKSYSNLGKRNKYAIEHEKLGKHMYNLIRLYMMCIDILEKEQIITYREDEHDLLMDIRNEKFLDENYQPTKEFYDLVSEYEHRLEAAKEHTKLPDKPDYEKINKFMASVNERVVKGEI